MATLLPHMSVIGWSCFRPVHWWTPRVRLATVPLVLFAVLILSANSAIGVEKIKAGGDAYTWAINGLWLRSGPAPDAKKITQLPYGTPVKILDRGQGSYSSVALSGQKNGKPIAYSIAGKWRKVNATIAGETKEGFIFDGWLTVLPPFRCTIEMDHGKKRRACETIPDWGKRHFGLKGKKFKTLPGADSPDIGETRYLFNNGIVAVENEPGYGSSQKLIIPGMGLSEGVVIAIASTGLWGLYDGEETAEIKITKNRIEFLTTYEFLYVTLTKDGVAIEDVCRDC